jgi:hypothetical protein
MKRSKVLQEEIDWFETAHRNAVREHSYNSEYLKGFAAAIDWLKLHRDIALAEEVEIHTYTKIGYDGLTKS